MTILLLGNDGQIGWELASRLPRLGRVAGFSYPAVDLARPDTFVPFIRRERPELIVNAAAYTQVDRAEVDTAAAHAVNATGPAILAEEAARRGALLVHYSTDYVFDGARLSPYTEEDAPHPLNVYGASKLEGDRAILASAAAHLIFRTCWIYGDRGTNFYLTISRLAAEGKPLRIIDDQFGSPTWCRGVAEATMAALEQVAGAATRLDARAVSGVYNMACGGQTSWYDFARAFLPAGTSVTPVSTAAYGARVQRPPYSVLDGGKLRRVFGLTLPAWDAALRAFRAAAH